MAKTRRTADTGLVGMEGLVRGLSPPPRRALLLAFEASLPFVERAILPLLKEVGPDSIDIIIDEIDYQNGRLESSAVNWAGVTYRVHPVRLRRGRFFHPKLCLLPHDNGAHVIVGSGNLTPGGWRFNLELIDYLHITEPSAASDGLVSLLEALPTELIGASHRLLSRLERELAGLQRFASSGSSEDPLILHNIEQSLLGQLDRRVDDCEIEEIIAVSPFYDESCAVIHDLARRHNATMRIIKDGRDHKDLNGPAILELSNRLTIEALAGVDGANRPLHAKCLALIGKRRAWMTSGSANLTAAAWLSSVARGGNLELITLREVSGPSRKVVLQKLGLERLLSALKTKEMAIEDLEYQKPLEPDPQDSDSRIELLLAEENDGLVTLECRHIAALETAHSIRVSLRSQFRTAAVPAEVERNGSLVRLRIPGFDANVSALLSEEYAIAVSVETLEGGAVVASGFRWLDRPDQLKLTAHERQGRAALANLLNGDTDPFTVIHALTALLDISDSDPDAFEEDADDSTVDDSVPLPPGRPPGTTGRATARRSSASRVLNRLFKGVGPTRAPARDGQWRPTYADLDDNEVDADQTADTRREPPTVPPAALFLAAASRAEKAVDELIASSWVQAAESWIFRRSIAKRLILLADTLVRLQWSARAHHRDETVASIGAVKRRVWNKVWSLSGWETGEIGAWFPRIWLDKSQRTELHRFFMDQAVVARALVSGASASLLDGHDTISAELFVPVSLVSGANPDLTAAALLDFLDRHVSLEAPWIGGASPAARLRAAIQPAGIGDTRGAAAVRVWQPLRQLINKHVTLDIVGDLLPRALCDELRRPRVKQSFARLDRNRSWCEGCGTSMTPRNDQTLRRSVLVRIACESCGAILVPEPADHRGFHAMVALDPQLVPTRVVSTPPAALTADHAQ
jgi:hypothetical protein